MQISIAVAREKGENIHPVRTSSHIHCEQITEVATNATDRLPGKDLTINANQFIHHIEYRECDLILARCQQELSLSWIMLVRIMHHC